MEWIKKIGSRELVVVACPHCDKLLNLPGDETKIRVRLKAGEEQGTLLLSAIWGDYQSGEEGIKVKSGEVCAMFCPHCGLSLQAEEPCKTCGATMTVFKFASGAIAICNRKGCQMHLRSENATITARERLVLSVSAWGGPYERL
jgi:hypothetical protein